MKKGATLYYQVGNTKGVFRNETFQVQVPSFPKGQPIVFGSFGGLYFPLPPKAPPQKTHLKKTQDFGVESANPDINGSIYDSLYAFSLNNSIQFTLHMGDIAYDLHTDNGTVGDLFMEGIEVAFFRP